ncbi:MAG: class I SAM-dependent methyltransferase [Selenomonadaceae bacterium]|nr:class I SAM-dependent methyltransferase [Selenomonadaceae bacterium]
MIKLNDVVSDYEPRKKIFTKLRSVMKNYRDPEMLESESAFLCGLLKSYKPKKILEVGVAKGGTTALVLQILEDLGEFYEMYSVDVSEECYSLKSNPTGYVATFAKENNLFDTEHSSLRGKHELHLGKCLPQVIDEIGGDIDFVILDTVHYTPGELLDFPVMLPYLKDNAIVVLHDVSLNQRNDPHHTPDSYATCLLLSAVTAPEKFLNSPKTDTFSYPNIGAFRVDESTRAHIDNVFMALMLTWHYLPKDDEVKIYREFYQKHYPEELVTIFDETVRLNRGNVALKETEPAPAKNEVTTPTDILTYQTHVAKSGWSKWISENRISNDITKQLDIQAIKINFPSHKVYYSVYYNEQEGWSEEVLAPAQAGTTGKSKPIMGIRIRLDEAGTKEFDILYRVHKFDGTWTDWVKNAEAIYSHGVKLNAIQIKLEPKTA